MIHKLFYSRLLNQTEINEFRYRAPLKVKQTWPFRTLLPPLSSLHYSSNYCRVIPRQNNKLECFRICLVLWNFIIFLKHLSSFLINILHCFLTLYFSHKSFLSLKCSNLNCFNHLFGHFEFFLWFINTFIFFNINLQFRCLFLRSVLG